MAQAPTHKLTPDEAEVVEQAKEQAEAKASSADLAADAAHELLSLAGVPMAPLNAPTQDVLGRDLPADIDKARTQQREAAAIRDTRVQVDVARAQRGLPPKYATK
jgi:hypothetical protein